MTCGTKLNPMILNGTIWILGITSNDIPTCTIMDLWILSRSIGHRFGKIGPIEMFIRPLKKCMKLLQEKH